MGMDIVGSYKVGFHKPGIDQAHGSYRLTHTDEDGTRVIATPVRWVDLHLLMQRLVNALNLVAQGPCASSGNESARADQESKEPAFYLNMADKLAKRFNACTNDTSRREVIADTIKELTAARYAGDRSEVMGTVAWKQAIANDPRGSRVLAQVYGVSHTTILKHRKKRQRRGH